jgi:hypothetical protein
MSEISFQNELKKALHDVPLRVKAVFAIVIILILALVILITSLISKNYWYNMRMDESAVTLLENDKMSVDSNYSSMQSKISKVESELSSRQSEKEALDDYTKNKDSLDSELSASQQKLDDLNKKASDAQKELNSLNNSVQKAKGAPKLLGAGHYTVGKDIPEGRYSVSGSSNFTVYDSIGDLTVNTILGNSSIGVGSYTCDLSEGDTIQTESKTTFTPIQ